MAAPLRFSAQAPSSRLEEILDGNRIEELSDTSGDSEYEDMGPATLVEQANIACLNSVRIPIVDKYETETSKVQNETHEIIVPFLEGNPNDHSLNAFGIPQLQRKHHATIFKQLLGDYPGRYATLDASRPWMVYWVLQSMTALGLDINSYQKT